jgi:lipopolysaccharide exporter
VVGNLARSLVRIVIFVASVDRRDWLEPCRLSIQKTREMLTFGLPIALGALCGFASRRWDNLLVSRFFGASPAGMYNLAYNLADVPAIYVGEQIGDVLLPSFARMDAERRPAALVRSVALLALVIFPLAIGLGALAPTLVESLFRPSWRPIGPMLVLLSALSVTRPIGWTVASYLQARQSPGVILALEAAKLVVLTLTMVTLGSRSPLWACVAVGIAFAAHALASLWIVRRTDGVHLQPLFAELGRLLAACVPMVGAVLGVRHLLLSMGGAPPLLRLALETLAGALVYPPTAWLVARSTARDLLARVLDALRFTK